MFMKLFREKVSEKNSLKSCSKRFQYHQLKLLMINPLQSYSDFFENITDWADMFPRITTLLCSVLTLQIMFLRKRQLLFELSLQGSHVKKSVQEVDQRQVMEDLELFQNQTFKAWLRSQSRWNTIMLSQKMRRFNDLNVWEMCSVEKTTKRT